MVKLTIEVANVDIIMLTYNYIRIYTSDAEYGTYTLLSSIPLRAGVSVYNYLHIDGDSDTWYRSSYYNTLTLDEGSLSNAVRGDEPTIFHDPTYPVEYEFTAHEKTIIRKIRRLIGDLIQLRRIYSTGDEFCTSIEADEHTINLGEKGWPVYISINNMEYTSLDDPVVQGYQYLTFSGSLVIDDQNPLVNIWFYTFQYSDREIYEAYGDAMIPPLVPANCVSEDHLMLQAAIDLLENLAAMDIVTDGAMIRDDQTIYDPAAGLRERSKLIDRLRKQLDRLVEECIKQGLLGIEGVLID